MGYVWDFAALKPYAPLLWRGLFITLGYTVTTVAAGLVIGLFTGIARTMGSWWLALPARAFIEVFRCTPLLVQLIWIYYALPVLIGVEMSAGTACFLSLSFYAGSFYAEIFRGGIEAIEVGQWEAGRALGMRRGRIFRRLILPQAIRVMIPSFINQTITQLKNTSLVSVVAVGDLLYQGTVVTATTYRPLEVYTLVAAVYFVVLLPITLVTDRVERRLGAHR